MCGRTEGSDLRRWGLGDKGEHRRHTLSQLERLGVSEEERCMEDPSPLHFSELELKRTDEEGVARVKTEQQIHYSWLRVTDADIPHLGWASQRIATNGNVADAFKNPNFREVGDPCSGTCRDRKGRWYRRGGERGSSMRGHPMSVQWAAGKEAPSEGAPYCRRRRTASFSERPSGSRNARRPSAEIWGRKGEGGRIPREKLRELILRTKG